MTYKIKSYIAEDGERFSLLLEGGDTLLPCFYPTAFISRHVRIRSTHETQKVYLNAIKKLMVWAKDAGIDIEKRIYTGVFMTVAELDDLARSLKLKAGKNDQAISQIKFNTYITYVIKYLSWLIYELLANPDTEVVNAYLVRLRDVLGAQVSKKIGSKSANAQRILNTRLSPEMEQTLGSLFSDPFQGLLRNSDKGSRLRNILMLRVLYETGMRRGELLALKLKNFHEGIGGEGPSLVVERNHNDEFDSRINQPVAKTNGRQLFISLELEDVIKKYLYDYRNELPLSGLDDEDFIFVNHRSGLRQGAPFTISSFDSAIEDLKTKFVGLKGLHPHLLRHHWNWRYSNLPKADGYTEESDTLDRCYLMGWAFNSEMAKVYNLKHISEEANKKLLMMGDMTARNDKNT